MIKSDICSIEAISLSEQQVTGDHVQTKFVPLSYFKANIKSLLWGRNAKRHNIGELHESIKTYGFLDFPKWDKNLNNGAGGITTGNGRTRTLVNLLIELESQGAEPPRGIPQNNETGEWCIPVNFGVDAKNEAQAIAYAIDHNNLTMSGGDFGLGDFAKNWDDTYLDLLTGIAEQNILPVSVDADDIATMLANLNKVIDEPPDDFKDFDKDLETEHTCPKCGYEWSGGK